MANATGLKDLITQVTNDLREIDEKTEGDGSLFVKEVIFEVHVMAVEKAGASGGLDLKVVSAGGDVAKEQTSIHKVTVKIDCEPPSWARTE